MVGLMVCVALVAGVLIGMGAAYQSMGAVEAAGRDRPHQPTDVE